MAKISRISRISEKEHDDIVTICDFVVDTWKKENGSAVEEALGSLFLLIADYEDANIPDIGETKNEI